MVAYMVSMVLSATIYPFLKRVTYYPQVWLGMVMSCEFLSAAQGVVDLYQQHTPGGVELAKGLFSDRYTLSTSSLTAAVVLFFVFFDVLYALADVEDDLKSESQEHKFVELLGVAGVKRSSPFEIAALLCPVACLVVCNFQCGRFFKFEILCFA
ncbi:hypothetical protein BDV12DRAFT_201953 [Aspergillus spectabilis]